MPHSVGWFCVHVSQVITVMQTLLVVMDPAAVDRVGLTNLQLLSQ